MSSEWGGRRRPPYAFTEHGVLMLSSVLNSEQAIAVNIRIMRVFVRLNRILQNDLELQLRVERMEGRQEQTDDALGEPLRSGETADGGTLGRPPADRVQGWRSRFDASLEQ